MTTTPERLGSLMPWRGTCGHGFVVYSLEPTPDLCPDCSDKAVKAMTEIVDDIDSAYSNIDCGDLIGTQDLDDWLDDAGVTEEPMRKDIYQLAQFCDEARQTLWDAYSRGKEMLKKYPAAERLVIPGE